MCYSKKGKDLIPPKYTKKQKVYMCASRIRYELLKNYKLLEGIL